MKKILTLLALSLLMHSNAQEGQLEKSSMGIQTGFLGVWLNNENRIAEKWVLRSEIGLDSGIWGGDLYDGTGFLIAPVITVEPRFYYNMEKRNKKGKVTKNNSGNFISLKTSYHPDWFVISNKDVNIISDISFIPTWGIKRSIGTSNFVYETGFGVGFQYIFYKSEGYSKNEANAILNLHLRIGYSF